MREILFRGKTYDGEWVYGGYFEDRDYHFIPRGIGAAFVEVEQGTVGQFTGLLDKNGNKIFEGDLLSIKDEVGKKGIVTVGFERGTFIVFKGLAFRNIGFYNIERNEIEIIGNIHDNKELLK